MSEVQLNFDNKVFDGFDLTRLVQVFEDFRDIRQSVEWSTYFLMTKYLSSA